MANERRRRLCHMIAFLTLYTRFLLDELGGADLDGQRQALSVLARIPYLDREVLAATRALTGSGDVVVRRGAAATIQTCEQVWQGKEQRR